MAGAITGSGHFEATRAKLLYRRRLLVVRKLQKAFYIDPKEGTFYSPEETPDPLVTCCLKDLRPTKYGKLGLYLGNAKAPAFSACLRIPRKATAELEAEFQEACDIYNPEVMREHGDLGSRIPIFPALIFEVNEQFYVYTSTGNVEDESVMLIRDKGRGTLRFIYSLQGYLIALGATTAPDEE